MKKKYLTIGEVSNITQVPKYTLRYWESEFKLLRPIRRSSGQRRYTQDDIHTIKKIKKLLNKDKYSIAGAKKQLVREKKMAGKQMEMPLKMAGPAIEELKKIKKDLLNIKKILNKN